MAALCFSIVIVCLLITQAESICNPTPDLDGAPEGYTFLTYQPLNTLLLNPGRGFSEEYSIADSNFNPVELYQLDSLRLTTGSTLVHRHYSLQDFVNTAISTEFIQKLNADFNIIREAGFMVILRFSYTKDLSTTGPPYKDASLERIKGHIFQLRDLLHAYRGIILVVQAGFIGVWGEWYYTDHFGLPPLNQSNLIDRREVIETLLYVVPEEIQIQLRTPAIKRQLYGYDPTKATDIPNKKKKSRLGHHNDCFLADKNDRGTYTNYITEFNYMSTDTERVIMGGETCAIDNISNRHECPNAKKELEKLHFTFLAQSYLKDVLDIWKQGACYHTIERKLGYVLSLVESVLPDKVIRGREMSYYILLRNQGFAAPAKEMNVYIVLMSAANGIYKVPVETNTRQWLPNVDIILRGSAEVPRSVTLASYQVWMAIGDRYLNEESDYYILLSNNMVPSPDMGLNNLTHSITVIDGVPNNFADCPHFVPWNPPQFARHPRILESSACLKTRLANNDFESTGNWVGLWKGFHYMQDKAQAFSGSGYIQINSSTVGGGAYQEMVFFEKPKVNLTKMAIKAWGKHSGEVTTSSSNYSLYCDVNLQNQKSAYGLSRPFLPGPQGTRWNNVIVYIDQPKGIKNVTCYLLFRGFNTGFASFDKMDVWLLSGNAIMDDCNFT
ncbi:uncharacterized protein LOC110459110 [Mizuhopecten yessoensis]|uniref:DUF4832 domain-containing protein n=1 Tax=Mizuhopecten yessoensis TaxID=6573 RepID=A0A210Q558_MIZYE|nr:uncharacterized protein LOC110459110 [Mizuhopecten yessoensis]XP_021366882.1 uncharacterized protein LOC110459110 [Mizuhopecten yessoensis]OWF43876.1 hypothetical protein KP79_PYT24618 [Mizuhopecten yessoensis]